VNLAPVRRRLSPERAHSKGPPIGQTCALSLASARTLSRPARTVYGRIWAPIWAHIPAGSAPVGRLFGRLLDSLQHRLQTVQRASS